MRNNTIIICAPSFLKFGGGISTFSKELALAIEKESCNPTDLILVSKFDVSGSFNGHPVIGCGKAPAALQTIFFALLIFFISLIKRPKIIISTHINFGPALLCVRNILNIPYILVAHGMEVSSKLSPIRQSALTRANGIWAVSEWTKKRLATLNIAPNFIQIIPNTISGEEFRLGQKNYQLRKFYGIDDNEMIILTVARLDPLEAYKGYDKIVQALPLILEIINVRYLVIGSGADGGRLLDIAAKLGVSKNVNLCGFIPADELAEHYRLADVFAMPSIGEGFGIVFLEAMACGIPVLGGNEDGSIDALSNGRLGRLVNPNNIEEIAKGLIEILQKRGPATWFSPALLREECLRQYGRNVFQQKVRFALDLAMT